MSSRTRVNSLLAVVVVSLSLMVLAGCPESGGGEKWPMSEEGQGDADVSESDAGTLDTFGDAREPDGEQVDVGDASGDVAADGGDRPELNSKDEDFCATFKAHPGEAPVEVHRNSAARWAMALPRGARYATVEQASRRAHHAAVYSHPDLPVHGFVMSREAESDENKLEDVPSVVPRIEGSRDQVDGHLGGEGRTAANNRSQSHFAAFEARECETLGTLRNELFGDIAGIDETSGLPSDGVEVCERWVVDIATIYRKASTLEGDKARVVRIAAIAPEDSVIFHRQVQTTQYAWSTGEHLAPASYELTPKCKRWRARQLVPVDLYWVVDSSIDPERFDDPRSRYRGLLEPEGLEYAVHNLEAYPRDVRWGITTMAPDRAGRLVEPPGWTRDGQAFLNAFKRIATMNETSSPDGVVSSYRGIERLRSRSDESGLRSGNWALIYVTDGPVESGEFSEEVDSFVSDNADRLHAIVANSKDCDYKTDFEGFYNSLGHESAYDMCRFSKGHQLADKLFRASQGKGFEEKGAPRIGSREFTKIPGSVRTYVGPKSFGYSATEGFVMGGNSIHFRGEARPDWPSDPERERAGATYYAWGEGR